MTDDEALSMAERLVRQFEGLRLDPYQDTAGVWTIGWGSVRIFGAPVTPMTRRITPEEADAAMMLELLPTYQQIVTWAPSGASDGQIAACTSLTYNVGLVAFHRSHLLMAWREGNVPAAADEFDDWDLIHDPETHELVPSEGLRRRRQMEKAVFLGTATV